MNTKPRPESLPWQVAAIMTHLRNTMWKNCQMLLLFLLVCSAGCNRGPQMATVTGVVNLNGTPVEDGRIQFEDVSGAASSAGAKIERGRYRIQAPPTSMKVRIVAYREVPGKFIEMNPGVKTPFVEQYIPPSYNEKSELLAELKEGNNEYNFELTGVATAKK